MYVKLRMSTFVSSVCFIWLYVDFTGGIDNVRRKFMRKRTLLVSFFSTLLFYSMGIFPMGNSGGFSSKKATCDRVALPIRNYLLAKCALCFVCDQATGYEAYSFTTGGYGIVNVRTKEVPAQTSWLNRRDTQTALHPAQPRHLTHRVFGFWIPTH